MTNQPPTTTTTNWLCPGCNAEYIKENPAISLLGWYRCDHKAGCTYAQELLPRVGGPRGPTEVETPSDPTSDRPTSDRTTT